MFFEEDDSVFFYYRNFSMLLLVKREGMKFVRRVLFIMWELVLEIFLVFLEIFILGE